MGPFGRAPSGYNVKMTTNADAGGGDRDGAGRRRDRSCGDRSQTSEGGGGQAGSDAIVEPHFALLSDFEDSERACLRRGAVIRIAKDIDTRRLEDEVT
jgi:hypothetical protein